MTVGTILHRPSDGTLLQIVSITREVSYFYRIINRGADGSIPHRALSFDPEFREVSKEESVRLMLKE
jgi:hypothetical protein